MFKIIVPIYFLGIVGFSLRRDRCYFDLKHIKLSNVCPCVARNPLCREK